MYVDDWKHWGHQSLTGVHTSSQIFSWVTDSPEDIYRQPIQISRSRELWTWLQNQEPLKLQNKMAPSSHALWQTRGFFHNVRKTFHQHTFCKTLEVTKICCLYIQTQKSFGSAWSLLRVECLDKPSNYLCPSQDTQHTNTIKYIHYLRIYDHENYWLHLVTLADQPLKLAILDIEPRGGRALSRISSSPVVFWSAILNSWILEPRGNPHFCRPKGNPW